MERVSGSWAKSLPITTSNTYKALTKKVFLLTQGFILSGSNTDSNTSDENGQESAEALA